MDISPRGVELIIGALTIVICLCGVGMLIVFFKGMDDFDQGDRK